jgi:RNA polymerase sigma-70 factor (ECF subfamily)
VRTLSDAEKRFDDLYRSTRRDVLAFLVRRVGRPADAADLLGDVYLVAWRRLDAVPGGSEARLWLFGVARRVLANHHRDARRRQSFTDGLAAALLHAGSASAPADASVLHKDRLQEVRRAIEALNPADREVLTLAAWDHLTAAEISTVTGATPGAVRVRLHRARERVRAAIAEGDSPEPELSTTS